MIDLRSVLCSFAGGPLSDQRRKVFTRDGAFSDGQLFRYVVRAGMDCLEHVYCWDFTASKYVYQHCGTISSETLDLFYRVVGLSGETGETFAEARSRMYSGTNNKGDQLSPRMRSMAAFKMMIREGGSEKDAADFVYGVLYSPMKYPWASPEARNRWKERGTMRDDRGKREMKDKRMMKVDRSIPANAQDPAAVCREAMRT